MNNIRPGPANAGFTLVEIMIVVAIIGMLASIAIPNFVRARKDANKNACICNLRQIEGAVQEFALSHHKEGAEPISYSDISDYLRGRVVCPSGGTTFNDSYQVTSVESRPVCLRSTEGEFAHRLTL